MRRIVNRLTGRKRRENQANKVPYFDAGFKSHENVFKEERHCRIGRREQRQAGTRRDGLPG